MTETLYKSPIAVCFFEALDSAADEYLKNGTVSFSTIENIVGKPPVIPDSPDMDARLEAYEEQVQYSKRVLDITSKIKAYAGQRS